ncbi:MAG: hypothetical protein PWP65_873 [Clostridia bacterium]|nr:hypothetical protein [Clostridia bacterium]
MATTIGIPRGLAYYYLYPFMEGFLRHLGLEVVVSPPSDSRTFKDMACCPTDEPCVSVKLFFAHAKYLLDKGVDYLFLPVLSSVEPQNYCCPKLIGAAAMVQNGFNLPPERVLAPEINEREKPGAWRDNFIAVAARLGKSRKAALEALERGLARQQDYYRLVQQEGLTLPEAYRRLVGSPELKRRVFDTQAQFDPEQVIGVMGHPYILYDLVGHNVVERLREYGRVITPEMVNPEDSRPELASIYEGEKMWAYEGRLLSAALYLLRRHLVNKMVLMEAFECGPASIIEAYIEAEAERQGIPFLILTVDEHTGEAGLVTRLEAFVDTAAGHKYGQKIAERAVEAKSAGQGISLTGNLAAAVPGPRPAKIKVGAPSMGWTDVALVTVLQECGVEMVPAPPVTKRTAELGKELAPEFICYPMVTTLGQIREVLEAGADTIIMVGGKGRCRLGWYAQLQELLLRQKGYDFNLTIIDSPVPWRQNWPKFRDAVRPVIGNVSWLKVIGALYLAYQKMRAIDEIESLVRRKRAYEVKRGAADKLGRRFIRRLEGLSSTKEIKKLLKEFHEELAAIEEEDTAPLKIKVVGEIYAVLENFVNHDLERFLASRPGLRVYVRREMSAKGWFDLHVLHKKQAVRHYHRVLAAAQPYLPYAVGGHGQESVGETILAKEEGFDGVIHLLPFTCMPEIVAQNILVPLCEKIDMPFLSLVLSEQTGTAGLETRLEAFLEVLLERRERKERLFGGEAVGLLPGY